MLLWCHVTPHRIHTVCTLLTSIQSLLTDPNCASPANPEAAGQYLKDRSAYNKWVWNDEGRALMVRASPAGTHAGLQNWPILSPTSMRGTTGNDQS